MVNVMNEYSYHYFIFSSKWLDLDKDHGTKFIAFFCYHAFSRTSLDIEILFGDPPPLPTEYSSLNQTSNLTQIPRKKSIGKRKNRETKKHEENCTTMYANTGI